MLRCARWWVGAPMAIRKTLCWVGQYVGPVLVVVVVGWSGSVEVEADERHAKSIKDEMGIEPGSNGVVSPAVRKGTREGETEDKLSSSKSFKSRAVVAGATCLVVDRPDLYVVLSEGWVSGNACSGPPGPSRVNCIARYL